MRHILNLNDIDVGFVDIEYVHGATGKITEALIVYFEIYPAFRNHGWGKLIFNAALNKLKPGDYPVKLIVDDDNFAALKIYQYHGFEIVGIDPFCENHYLMQQNG